MKQKIALFAAACLLAGSASTSRADFYPDAIGDTCTTNAQFDIASVVVVNDTSNLYFTINFAGNPLATNLVGYYAIALVTGPGGCTNGNGSGAAISLAEGINYWVSCLSWGQPQLWRFNSTNSTWATNTTVPVFANTTNSVSLTVPYASVGLTPGQQFKFDAYTFSGTGGAVDDLANPQEASIWWNVPYTNNLVDIYPNPALGYVYFDNTNDLFTAIAQQLDIASVAVSSPNSSEISFTINLVGNPQATNWGSYAIALVTGPGGCTNGNGSGAAISLTEGINYWVTCYGWGNAQLCQYNPNTALWTTNNTGLAFTNSSSSVTLTMPYASVGLTNGERFQFDAYTFAGTGGAVDDLANPNEASSYFNVPYTNNLVETYPVAVYADATNDIWIESGNPELDISSVGVWNDSSNLSFTINLVGNPKNNSGQGEYAVALVTGPGGCTNGNGSGVGISLTEGMNYWIFSYGSGSPQLWQYSPNTSTWSSIGGATSVCRGNCITLTVPYASLGLTGGANIQFDAYTFGYGSGAVDDLANPNETINWYSQSYTNNLLENYTLTGSSMPPPSLLVTYNGNGNTGGTAPVDPNSPYNTGSTVTVLGAGTLTQTGYTFAGWNTAANASGTAYAPNATFTLASNAVLYAQWTANTYTVTFNAVGGSVSPTTISVTYGSTYGTLPTPTQTGFTFNGWFTASSGGSQVLSTTPVTITSAQTLYAQWTPNTYTVTFNAEVGSVSPATVTVTYASAYGTLPTPTQTGYAFNGWFTASSGGMLVTSATTVAITSVQTLYAQWTPNTYTVTLNPEGGSVSPATVNVTYGATYGTLPTPTQTGYTFNGWFTTSSGGSQVTSATTVAITSAQTLYAQWTLNTYTVTFNAEGGSVSPATALVTYGSTYGTLPTPTQTGYVFNGWFTASSGGTQVTSATTVTITAAQTLYAQWTPNCTAPVIVGGINPGSANVAAFSPVVFSLTNASGTILTYQWQSNSVSIVGATNSSYTNLSVTVAAAANYVCVVTNNCGAITSSIAVLTVIPQTPLIAAMPTPVATLTYGQTLASAGLTGGSVTNSAGASVSGNFLYANPSATPDAGTDSQDVIFMPTDTNDYNAVITSVNVTVGRALLSVTPNNASRLYGQTNPVFSGTITGIQNEDNITATYATTATTNSPTKTYQIIPTLVDPDGSLVDYIVTYNNGMLTIGKTTPAIIAVPLASPITYGQTLASSILTGGAVANPFNNASVPGNYTFNTTDFAPNAGIANVAVTFSPTDTTNYNLAATNVSVTVNKGAAAVTLGNLVQTYDGTGESATATTVPSGLTVNLTYNGSASAPTSAGNYTVIGNISDANYQGSATNTLVINKGTAAVTLANLNQTYDGTAKSATATTVPIGLTVNLTYNGLPSAPTNAGSYSVIGNISDANYQGSATNTLVINQGTATVTLANLSQTYDGTGKSATATTVPGGLAVNLTYNGSAGAPTNAGSYTVVGTINDANYQGGATNTLVINKGTATVALANLSQTYDGTAKSATATTVPSGLTVNLTYNGSASAPTNTGTYTVVGTVSDANYTGSATNTLAVSKAAATVVLGNLVQTYDGTGKSATATTIPAGLTVAFTYAGSVNLPVNVGSYQVIGTVNDANYAGSATNNLVIGLPPQITSQPTNEIVPVGGTAQFSVVATGTPTLTYQWWFNQTNLLALATNSTLTLTNIAFAQAGDYSVVVQNPFGSITSTSAVLALVSEPTISGCNSFSSATNPVTGSQTVTLNATVNPNGLPTTAAFLYGLTASYAGSSTPVNLPAGSVGSNVSTSLASIVPGVVYHWQVVASNSLGGVATPDQTFYTASIYPPIYPPGAIVITNGEIVDQTVLNAVLANYWPNSPWVSMTNNSGLGSTNVQFALTNANNWDFSVLVSTNLTDWQYLGPATPVYQFTDPTATNAPQRYYRLQWP